MPKTLESTPIETISSDVEFDEAINLSQEEIDAVVAELNPRSEVDQEGFNRTTFEYGDVSFSFMGRNETPIFPALENSNPNPILRQPPKGYEYYENRFRENDQINQAETLKAIRDNAEEFRSKLSEIRQNHQDQPEHILVEQSAYGMFGLLAELDQEGQDHWRSKQAEVEQGTYNQESLDLIDSVVATNTYIAKEFGVGPDGVYEFVRNHPPYGESVVTLAILGSDKAKELVLKSLEHQKRLDEQAKAAAIEENRKRYIEDNPDLEPFKPEDLMIIHATTFRPEQTEDGYNVQSVYDATDIPRGTIHTAISHLVGANMWRTGGGADMY